MEFGGSSETSESTRKAKNVRTKKTSFELIPFACRPYRAVAKQRKEGHTLPSLCLATNGGINIQTHRLMGGIYGVRR
jgi:hypothetical protein